MKPLMNPRFPRQTLVLVILSLLPYLVLSTTPDTCHLPSQNISLSSLNQPYYVAYGGSTNVYLSICQPLSGLPPKIKTLCPDPNATVCVTKILQNKTEVSDVPNAGRIANGSELIFESNQLSLKFVSPTPCIDQNGKSTNISTRIDFMCNENENQIRYKGLLGKCIHYVWWYTSAACLPEQIESWQNFKQCTTEIPGYDAIIDLSTWASDAGYYLAKSVDAEKKERYFQLNICEEIVNGSCPDGSVACEVTGDSNEVVKNLSDATTTREVAYNEGLEEITLSYISKLATVEIFISCSKVAVGEPEISLISHDANHKLYKFRFLTSKACLKPPVECVTEDEKGNVYDLSVLQEREWEIVHLDRFYQIKVCGSLPMEKDNPCWGDGQVGVCSFRRENNKDINPINMGLNYKSPSVSKEGLVSLLYEFGDSEIINATTTCNRSVEINLSCFKKEIPPKFASEVGCHTVLSGSTPAACPVQTVESHDCTVRDPLYNYKFDLTSLYNDSRDYKLVGSRIGSNKITFIVNICGQLKSVSTCSSKYKNIVCLEAPKKLTYESGTLEMNYDLPNSCPSNKKKTMTATIHFLCSHSAGKGQPKIKLPSLNPCHVDIEWFTTAACPPHDQSSCTATAQNGSLYDLSVLSLPQNNYHVVVPEQGQFIINVCRSLVHNSNQSHCPYKSAACLEGRSGEFVNLGEVNTGPQVNPNGTLYLTYTLGALCADLKSNRNHKITTIYFTCAPGVFDSHPEFVEEDRCEYRFSWRHASACKVEKVVGEEGNCTVTNPETGFTFDLHSLHNSKANYRWNSSFHHYTRDYQFNLCGPMVGATACKNGSGICMTGKNLGMASSDLQIRDGQLSLKYMEGDACVIDSVNWTMFTTVNFNCPRKFIASSPINIAKEEIARTTSVVRKNMCNTTVNFLTDLACDHQVFCGVQDGETFYNLAPLRRHDHNYYPRHADGHTSFILNVCGPLVSMDLPSFRCRMQGACGPKHGSHRALGKVLSSPQMEPSGEIEIVYVGGDTCKRNGTRWSTRIVFKCDKRRRAQREGFPLGYPVHIKSDDVICEDLFHFPTVLACNDTGDDHSVNATDSCQLYNAEINYYSNITSLRKEGGHEIYSKKTKKNYYIQPCGHQNPNCRGGICKKDKGRFVSLGSLTRVSFDDSALRVQYIHGDICDEQTRKRHKSTIYYYCDPHATGSGTITLRDEIYNCTSIFEWYQTATCNPSHVTDPQVTTGSPPASSPSPHSNPDVLPPAAGGISWSQLILVLLLISAVVVGVFLYRKPQARHKVVSAVESVWHRVPVMFSRDRGRGDSTLLVGGLQEPAFGSLSDDEELLPVVS